MSESKSNVEVTPRPSIAALLANGGRGRFLRSLLRWGFAMVVFSFVVKFVTHDFTMTLVRTEILWWFAETVTSVVVVSVFVVFPLWVVREHTRRKHEAPPDIGA